MKRKVIAAAALFVAVMVTALSTTVNAVAPGFSDFEITPVVAVQPAPPTAPGEPPAEAPRITSPETGVSLNISLDDLPTGTTGVSLGVAQVPRGSADRVEVENAVAALPRGRGRTAVVEAININLTDQNQQGIAVLENRVRVSVPAPRGVRGEVDVAVVHPETGQLIIMRGSVDARGFLTFRTPVMGTFLILRR